MEGVKVGRFLNVCVTGIFNATGSDIRGIGGEWAENSFYDKGRTGATAGKGTGLTTAEMKKASTYSSWDTSIWNIVDGSYPTLKIDWKEN